MKVSKQSSLLSGWGVVIPTSLSLWLRERRASSLQKPKAVQRVWNLPQRPGYSPTTTPNQAMLLPSDGITPPNVDFACLGSVQILMISDEKSDGIKYLHQ